MRGVATSETFRGLRRQLDLKQKQKQKQKQNCKLFSQHQQLEKKIEQLKPEQRLEREAKFATTSKQKADSSAQGLATALDGHSLEAAHMF